MIGIGMSNAKLTEFQWLKILEFRKPPQGIDIGVEQNCRQFIEAALGMLRSGAQWRLLPSEPGKWNSVYKRFTCWGEQGIFDRMLSYFAASPDLESIMIDSTVVRAHACAAGATHPEDKPKDQALGRSTGGLSTKIHILVDALGNPLEVTLTGGPVADVTQAIPLLEGRKAPYGIMDKAYDAYSVIEQLEKPDIIPVIPPTANRKVKRHDDKPLYKERHLMECFIGKLKQFRRVFPDSIKRQFTL
jgi:transposase